jgi:hypothetical protein
MTKTPSPCEIALFGHSGSQAPQLMQSLVIIVAMKPILQDKIKGMPSGVKVHLS